MKKLLLLLPVEVCVVSGVAIVVAVVVVVEGAGNVANEDVVEGGGKLRAGITIGTCGSRRQSSVGRGLIRGIAAPYVIKMSSSAGNITNIPGRPHVTWRLY